MLALNLPVSAGNSVTPAIQVPNGATKVTVQFTYSGLDADVVLSMHQSLDGGTFDACLNENDEPVSITLDHQFTSMTLNIIGLLTTWLRFTLQVQDATSGFIEKLNVLME